MLFFFFFKQKTAYEMRISDWSSDVCSSDLPTRTPTRLQAIDLEFAACGHGTLGLHHQLGFDVGGASDVVEAQRQRRARRNRAASSLAPLALRTPVHRFGKDRGSFGHGGHRVHVQCTRQSKLEGDLVAYSLVLGRATDKDNAIHVLGAKLRLGHGFTHRLNRVRELVVYKLV